MKTSSAGRAEIARREGNKLTAYVDSGGVLTIGVGHTSAAGAPKVTRGLKITAAQSDEILSRDLADVEATVNAKVKVPLNQNEFDALVSLAFNIGGSAFAKSTLLRKLNAGDRAGAAAQFAVWNKDNGKTIPGLTTRRAGERKQFLRPVPMAAPKPAPKPATPADIYTSKAMVQVVQARLVELGYPLGAVDGVLGSLTKSSIRDFRADNGLSEGEAIDAAMVAALDTAKPRKLAPARADAPVEKVAEKAPETAANWRTEVLAKYGIAGSIILSILDWISKQFEAGQEKLQPVIDLFLRVPGWAWFMLVAAVLLALWWHSRKGRIAGVEAFRAGARL